MSKLELLVFDSHPVQARVPIWQVINRIAPDSIHVVYATISSVKGYYDQGFGEIVAWDMPLLEGYAYSSLESVNGTPFSGYWSLTGKGVRDIIQQLQPKAILLTGLNYQFDQTALREARKAGIPVSLRCTNQDEAFARPVWKDYLRSVYYRYFYRSIDRFYYIGQLNKQHYMRHGVRADQLFPARYFTVDRVGAFSAEEKAVIRAATRTEAGIDESNYVIGFAGKLIPKKNPAILFRLLDHLPGELRSKTVVYFMGSGELESTLKQKARQYFDQYGVKAIFTGFVNQSKIAHHYLAMDTFILPSRQMGETWGLVVNEALQAGCSVVVSNYVGCGEDFKSLERFRVFEDNKVEDLAGRVVELAQYPRTFNWARPALEDYTLEACAEQIARSFNFEHA
jgi:glycosyltransferase involved in cell wall biosynthesis